MAAGPFLSHDTGFKSLLGTGNWTSAATYYAILATNTEAPDRAAQIDYEDILAEVAGGGDYEPKAIVDGAVAVNSTKVRFTCAKLTFTAEGDISARYLYILKGTAALPVASDEIIGHIDLVGSAANISSVNSEFSFTPDGTNGLFEVLRTAAPA